jgi:flagellin
MSSILTNTSAMAALQTLRSINSDMETTQGRISSGQRVGTASDNAAYWSIATTMRSDNAALSSVQDAMGLGAAKVDTAYAGLESTIDVIKEIKNKLITAQESTADKSKIQQEIKQLQGQLKSISESASFSGENWLKAAVGTNDATDNDLLATAATVTKQVVGSFTRDASGNVKVQSIDVELNSGNVLFDNGGAKMGILDQDALRADIAKVGDSYYDAVAALPAVAPTDPQYTEGANNVWSNGTDFYLKAGEGKFVAVADAAGVPSGTAKTLKSEVFATGTSVATLDISDMDAARTAFGLAASASDNDVLDQMISHVDKQLEAVNAAAADMGSVSMRLDLQQDFVSKLSDAIEAGVGRLVDADMNEESTRLKALQTQQQLGIQALSIANSNSQNILSLFR